MFTNSSHQRRGTRRGVVLILVLGMLGLMALIGIMFATYSGQAEINARNYALAQNAPEPANVLDFALAQLINDTNNPQSALRGHSLLRDMYGNDASSNGYLKVHPTDGTNLTLQSATQEASGLWKCVTNNLSADSAFGDYNFTRWILRFPPNMSTTPTRVAETFEVIADDRSGTNITLYVSPPEPFAPANPLRPTIRGYASPETAATQSLLIGLQLSPVAFELDGRFLRAFNGPGMGDLGRYPNFRVNGGDLTNVAAPPVPADPNPTGMDEDYDACDLENWFLAIQSADGQVIIPSFHRPGILTNADWTNTSAASRSKFLRPRGGTVDGHSAVSFPDLKPDAATGKITYDVDNDGDGITDAVWLDLGYPASRNAAGQLQKPLFAFTVIGLNGRMPLNTVGNLQRRLDDGTPTNLHAAHLGNSPSEIDPTYALQNAYDPNNTGLYAQGDGFVDVRHTQLRNLLTGTRPQNNPYVLDGNNGDSNKVLVNGQDFYLPNNLLETSEAVRDTLPVAGRWGEEEGIPRAVATAFNNPIRAGLSQRIGGPPPGYGDASDDNLNTFDPFPAYNPGPSPTFGEQADYYDAAGGLSLPSERIRRFLTPIDISGDGRIRTWDKVEETGADQWGRVNFFHYFRPPGVPVASYNYPTGTTAGTPVIPNRTNNHYHGYEAFRRPKVTSPLAPERVAGMPFNANSGTLAPTYNQSINSNLNPPSAALNEADEMRLYAPNGHDAPYGPGDLQWLYRLQDVDGTSLNSRLAKLAPVSFLNPFDGIRRRRMFSTDTWETTNFVWANDNPGGTFSTNSRFVQQANASFANLKVPAGSRYNNALFNNLEPASPANGTVTNDPVIGPPALTPSLAHRDRKINLNYPLPVSNDPDEPIRQKWIRDTYQMLKAVLPPLAVDTPQELAQLSQFVVNMVDFRDPDAAMTRFVNRDLQLLPVKAVTPATIPPTFDPPSLAFAPGSAGDLVQFGMEYNPIAINEVLAYSFTYRNSTTTPATPTQTNRLYIELVNTLTEAESTPSDLDLAGWRMVILPDDPRGRPDPVTGQIPKLGPGVTIPRPEGTPATTPSPAPLPISGAAGSGLPTPGVLSLKGPTPGADATGYYYVLGNAAPTETPPSETLSPTAVAPLPAKPSDPGDPMAVPPVAASPATTLLDQLPLPGANAGPPPAPADPPIVPPPPPPPTPAAPVYMWLYLLRPANPVDATSTSPVPMVVVDSLRFPFSEGQGTGTTNAMNKDTVTVGTMPLYSVQRLQPFRGGESVPKEPGGTEFLPADAYGYSDQTSPPTLGATGVRETVGMYGDDTTQTSATADGKITLPIYNTIGAKNVPSEPWDYLPFHDRDFTSVAELLLVPGCPPGLFTKKFAELTPPLPPGVANITPPTTAPTTLNAFDPTVPHPFPYLVDNFFYTGASTEYKTPPTPRPTGGLTGAGWFKMFEFLEVPSPAAGATGTVAQGNNYDWFRQDVKPGLLNLNLIIDEEVFLGLMADPRLNMAQMPFVDPTLETGQADPGAVPKVVTMIDTSGSPAQLSSTPLRLATYPMSNRGFLANFPYDANSPYVGAVGSRLKVAFSDFLKLRHGGSGYLFAFGTGAVGQAGGGVAIAGERPFRSLSFPDINYTVMRPATLPPSSSSNRAANPPLPVTAATMPATQPTPFFVWDPGVKNPYLFAETSVQPPPIPPRRLFQIPDNHGSTAGFTSPPAPPASNASTIGDARVNTPTTAGNLRNPNADLTAIPQTTPVVDSPYLGSITPPPDTRQHPYFRTEWLQKAMNLTTVRTHQYAVWITVGFFEVKKQGNPQLAATDPVNAVDQLGLEIGAMAGRNVRYRSFYILDRTRAHGFNPSAPGDFRDVVTYRQRIQ